MSDTEVEEVEPVSCIAHTVGWQQRRPSAASHTFAQVHALTLLSVVACL